MPGRRGVPQPSDPRSRECSDRMPPRFLAFSSARARWFRRRCNAKNAANITFRMAAASSVHSIRQTAWTLCGTFLPMLLHADGAGNKADKRMPIRYAEPLLTHEFPDIVIFQRTLSLRCGRCDEKMRGHASWSIPSALRGLQLESFDSTRAYECLGSRSCENQRQEVFL